MTSSPDLIHELRASRPSAPADLRTRIRTIAAEQPVRTPWASWRFPVRRGMLVAVPAAATLALASAGVVGLTRSDSPQAVRQDALEKSNLEAATPSTSADQSAGRTQSPSATTTDDRAQLVSATLTVEVKDADAVSRAAQSALELTRTLGGFVVSSSIATGDEGSASIVVRVPVDEVQDAITGLSGLGRIVSQQVTTADRAGEHRRRAASDSLAPRADRCRHLSARVRDARRRDAGASRGASEEPQGGPPRRPPEPRRATCRGTHVDHPAHRRDSRCVRRGRPAFANRPR